MDQYKVVERSVSCHCCFKASVVDTSRPDFDGGGEIIEGEFAVMCECFEIEAAMQIAASLNRSSDV